MLSMSEMKQRCVDYMNMSTNSYGKNYIIDQNPGIVLRMENPSEEQIIRAINRNNMIFLYLKTPSSTIIEYFTQLNPMYIVHVNPQFLTHKQRIRSITELCKNTIINYPRQMGLGIHGYYGYCDRYFSKKEKYYTCSIDERFIAVNIPLWKDIKVYDILEDIDSIYKFTSFESDYDVNFYF